MTTGGWLFAVTANFTAEPVEPSIRFWAQKVGLWPIRVEFSGYNQVLQELLNPASSFNTHVSGANIILIRLEDWARGQVDTRKIETIASTLREFTSALSACVSRASRQTIVVVCPVSRQISSDERFGPAVEALQRECIGAIKSMRGVALVTWEDVAALYPVETVEDMESDRQGHMPFTNAYWAALGTMIVRKLRPLFQPPYKVVVVDGDNTLWGGVVGEVGADHVRIDESRKFLHAWLLNLKRQGWLLALASKNEETDVTKVFFRADMDLHREDFVAWKVNWEPKSLNISILAKELELGLDSFVFLDDNPIECAEVSSNCTAVTVLQVPSESERLPEFLKHAWVFDGTHNTVVDEKRTELYRQQSQRNQFRNAVGSFRDFIAGLQLEVSIGVPLPSQMERAAQLTQRTNQFNTTGIRRNVAELTSLLNLGRKHALLVGARDRFGDYGEVGLAIYSVEGHSLTVETLLMSCRVLGKGVEHELISHIGKEAERMGLDEVVLLFKPSERNQPAKRFLGSIGAVDRGDGTYRLPSVKASKLRFEPESTMTVDVASEGEQNSPQLVVRPDFSSIATRYRSVDSIVAALALQSKRQRPPLPIELLLPRTDMEARLCSIWQEVLHISEIGVQDPFLNLGGKSLQAVSIVSRIATEFGVRIPLERLLTNTTVAEIAVSLKGGGNAQSPIQKTNRVVLSRAQQRLWFLDQFIPNRAAYNIPVTRLIRGRLSATALQSAYFQLLARHDQLRSTYSNEGGATTVQIHSEERRGWDHLRATSRQHAMEIAQADACRPFDLTKGPVVRCLLISWSDQDHLLALTVHHIVCDGWSIGILLRDLNDAYESAVAGRPPSFIQAQISYSDYAAWQDERLTSGDFRDDVEYWRRELRDVPSLLEVPTDYPRPLIMSYKGARASLTVSAKVRQNVEQFADREGCTPFAVILSAWQTLLGRYSRQDDIVVGVPVAGRTHPLVENVVGCFVNTLAIRSAVEGAESFRHHVRVTAEKLRSALARQEIPFECVVNEMGAERNLSRSPLFQVMLVYQDTPPGEFHPAGMEVVPSSVHNGGAKFDFVLEVTPVRDYYELSLEFDASLFGRETAERVLAHFAKLLEEGTSIPDTPLAALPMMTAAEIKQTIACINRSPVSFTDIACLHHWFERRVESAPLSPAVTCNGEWLSYQELNVRANRLAHWLIECGVGPDVLVGICLDRSPNLIVAILAVLKAGGAYLPIDLSYPSDRLEFMLSDAQAALLLTEKKLLSTLPRHHVHTICLDEVDDSLVSRSSGNPVTRVTPESMAYVIYTSGSTGKPKGCMVTHRNVSRLMRATEQWYGFNEQDVWTLFHSTAFDFSVWEIWGALLYGGRLVIVPFIVSRSPEGFYELLVKEQVTVLNQTPSAFRQLINADAVADKGALALRYVIFGGEALELQSLRPWFEKHGDQRPKLINMYGITETTVHVTYRPLRKHDVGSGSVIGLPIPDLQLYLLDEHKQVVPCGVPGELYVGGDGLARGYLSRPELTAERFIPDHITGKPTARLYRTGDLGRIINGQEIEYLGRIDHQVKIRGFRIELGEIESILCQHPAIREAVVLAQDDGASIKRLSAYVVASLPWPSIAELREHLKRFVPDYMVPSGFVLLEQFPLTVSGKVDRKALLQMAAQQDEPVISAAVQPQTELESAIAEVWKEVLKKKQISVEENFFDLGGDSLLIVQVHARLRKALNREFPLVTIFEYPTVRSLAGHFGSEPHLKNARLEQWQNRANLQKKALTQLRIKRGKNSS